MRMTLKIKLAVHDDRDGHRSTPEVLHGGVFLPCADAMHEDPSLVSEGSFAVYWNRSKLANRLEDAARGLSHLTPSVGLT
jgi:hypothetical protein